MTQEEISNFYKEQLRQEKLKKIEEYKRRNKAIIKNQILFAGSSLMENFPISEIQSSYDFNKIIYNRGIGGFIMQEFEENLDTCVFDLEPAKMFLNIGTNDMNDADFSLVSFIEKYERILKIIMAKLPNLKIYLMAYYPVNIEVAPVYMKHLLMNRTNEKITMVNNEVLRLAAKLGLNFIDVNQPLKDAQGCLKAEYAMDGMHFYADGYQSIMQLLVPYIEEN